VVTDKYLNLNEYDPPDTCKYPGAYASFEGSPAQLGKLQFDLWNVEPTPNRYDWESLKNDIQEYGMRNSLLVAPMPTASTSQICGFTECFEPITSNIYKRKTMAGEFILVNKYLVDDLLKLGIWNADIKNKIIVADGSVQEIEEIPKEIRDLYKTVWEIKQKVIIDLAADRGAFVCQSMSMNLFMSDPDFQKLSSMHFYSWDKGLKTGIYYLRSKSKGKQQKFTMDPNLEKLANLKEKPKPKNVVCTDEVCIVCQG
jgi:ribonucleoside-diphosphate reductase alpha chain